jgi:aryl-alcohol dehydrogenase-like predicted oxidoreductase
MALADMRAFVDAGITSFDCADIYTGVEALIGEFVRTVPAGTVRVHTKCVPDLDRLATLTAGEITDTVFRSRERLGVAAIDLVQLHWWDYALGDFVAAARTLVELRAAGALREIGLTNFGVRQVEALLAADIPVATHQVQYSLLDRRPARTMAPLCEAHGIGLLCYGALAGGFFHERWLGAPEPVDPFENRSLLKYKLIIDDTGGWDRFQRLLHLLDDVARRHRVSIGTVAIRWVLEQPGVRAVIVGARNASHLAATTAALSLALTDEEQARITAHLADQPIPPGDVYELERDRDGRHGRIMRYNLSRA